MKAEYLICINKKNGRAIDKTSLLKSFEVNPEIIVDYNNSTILFHNVEFPYTLQCKSNDINVFFHLTVDCIDVEPFDLENETVKALIKLMNQVECAVRDCHGKFEIVWNDINFKCSQIAYPKIYEIENLFRKLITKFMLFNVGDGWEDNYVPNEIAKGLESDKAKSRNGGLLYKLDFDQIRVLLFGVKAEKVDLKKLWDLKGKEKIKFSDIEKYLPENNWDRFFKGEIDIDEKQLDKNWKDLYDLRCKVAHNLIFTPDDLKRVEVLIGQINPAIEKAIEKMDDIVNTKPFQIQFDWDFIKQLDVIEGFRKSLEKLKIPSLEDYFYGSKELPAV